MVNGELMRDIFRSTDHQYLPPVNKGC